MSGGNWRSWQFDPPRDRDREIEYQRGKDGPIERVVPSQTHPLWNVADVYWRAVEPKDNLFAIHATLQQASDSIIALRANLSGLSVDAIYTLGEAAGLLAKVKSLVQRDIDDRKRKAQ